MICKLLDKQVKNIFTYIEKSGIGNKVVAVVTEKALIERVNLEHLKNLDLENSSWAKSLFKKMGFVKRVATTGRRDIPECAEKEAKILFLHQIVDLVEEIIVLPH